MGTPIQRSNSGSAKRKKPKDSPKSTLNSQLYGHPSTTASSKFLAGKGLTKYGSVDQLFDNKKAYSKPSLKVKPSKITGKISKNISVDEMYKRSMLDNELRYSNMKIKKDKSKLKKKKSKQDMGYLNKQFGAGERGPAGQEPLSINIVNTNHLHLSGYNNPSKASAQQPSVTADGEKKENFHSIIKQFKPNQIKQKPAPVSGAPMEEEKTKKFKQEIKTTKPKKTKKSEGKYLVILNIPQVF